MGADHRCPSLTGRFAILSRMSGRRGSDGWPAAIRGEPAASSTGYRRRMPFMGGHEQNVAPNTDASRLRTSAISRPLCCQEALRALRVGLFALVERDAGAAGRRVALGSGVASPKSRFSGCESAALALESFPVCPPGPMLDARARCASICRWRKITSLMRRFSARSASLPPLPSASFRS